METVFKAASCGDLPTARVAHEAAERMLEILPADSNQATRVAHRTASRLLRELAALNGKR